MHRPVHAMSMLLYCSLLLTCLYGCKHGLIFLNTTRETESIPTMITSNIKDGPDFSMAKRRLSGTATVHNRYLVSQREAAVGTDR